MTLQGKTALVTGGSRGIGRAIALALSAAGARVAFCHPGDAAAGPTLAALDAQGEAMGFAADVSDEAQVIAFHDAAFARFGAPDILVNNAGILHEAPLRDTSAGDFDKVIAVNLRGCFLNCREFSRRSDAGRIINIASELALVGRADLVAYCASKGAILSLTKALARELAPGILVNAIAPGPIETDMTAPASMSPEQIAMDLASPLARYGQPGDIAAMARFLAGEEAGFITGQCFGVNGGSAMP
ncbi:glucose 1-dehydrogenase [Salipiger sp. 1_MG-2023]|uniref:SDR family NAD(P)-dependent oxidoreductase n=1 Tax=Salipiger sp. 1_MG-2023 TaxID=3062665 RepID=UPI0026E3069E|nr:glucose 1-dehydrogenase [Salipiger sp. 1_MG-2023]MDO6586087.1 glucose 1-dehydrogenase [Salipiger sp. 1_MG-2023]